MSTITAQHLEEIDKVYTVDEWLDNTNYEPDSTYIPSTFALEMVNFIKLVNGTDGESNKTPVLHMKMLDQIATGSMNIANLVYRGAAKSTLMEYIIFYIAVNGRLPTLKVSFILYISDSIENGIKTMRKSLEYRWDNSNFLKKYIPKARFTDVRWDFWSLSGEKLTVRGFGAQALSLDSILYKEDGYTTMKEVSVGDKIYGPEGKLCKVSAKSEIFYKKMYELVLRDGRRLKVSEDHINSIAMKQNPIRSSLSIDTNITTRKLLSIPLRVKKNNKKGDGSYSCFIRNTEPVQRSNKRFDLDPYLLGLMLGDGSMKLDGSNALHAHIDDMPFYISRINETLGSPYIDKRNNTVMSLSIKKISKKVDSLGLRGIKMNKKFIPEQYMFGSITQRRELLAGLLDSDGTILKCGRISFTNTSVDLVEGVSALVRSLGGTAYKKSKCIVKSRSHKQKYKIEIVMQINPFNIPRKADRWIIRKRDHNMVAISNINELPLEPSQCIAIESESHQYLSGSTIGDYFRTHNTGVRGTRESGSRPQLALLDDLVSDDDARSPTVIASIEDTVYKAIDYALDPTDRMILWNGTPFNASDPLFKAVESGAWDVNVYPVCERFPCSEEEFMGAWPDRHTYKYVLNQYTKAKLAGKLDAFMQELMLRITSDEDKLIRNNDILWFDKGDVVDSAHNYNFYITTDFATSEKQSADYSVISVWAYNSNEDWMLVDGELGRNLMDKNIDTLFDMVVRYGVQSVGVEVTGQQGAFVTWIRKEMHRRNVYFTIQEIRPVADKLKRFHNVVPLFRRGKMWFSKDMIGTKFMNEAMNEINRAMVGGFKSSHDDFLDTVSSLSEMKPWKPQQALTGVTTIYNDPFYENSDDPTQPMSSYIV